MKKILKRKNSYLWRCAVIVKAFVEPRFLGNFGKKNKKQIKTEKWCLRDTVNQERSSDLVNKPRRRPNSFDNDKI